MKAREIMSRPVVWVKPQTPLAELGRLLDGRKISGVPVVGPKGHLIGVVTRLDLLRHRLEGEAGSVAADAMTPWVVSMEDDTELEALGKQMVRKRIHRIFITREGALVGVVTSVDMLRALGASAARSGERRAAPLAGEPQKRMAPGLRSS